MRKKVKNPLTHEYLVKRYVYDPETGVFNSRRLGCAVGRTDIKGYTELQIKGNKYRGHRLAWFYMEKVWPTLMIDHINGIKADNRWANLRLVTNSQNQQNKRNLVSNNTSGYTGVHWSKQAKRWIAYIKKDGKRFTKWCSDKESAIAARIQLELEMYTHTPLKGDA